MKKLFNHNAMKLLSSFALVIMLLGMVAQTAPRATAAILFQDDTFATIESDAIMIGSNDAGANNTAIQFGADAISANNGIIRWNIGTNNFTIDHSVGITGGLSADGSVDFSASTSNRLRESTNPNTLAACATTGEVIIDTTTNTAEVCDVTGVAGVAHWKFPVAAAAPSGPTDPLTCSAGDFFYNTTIPAFRVCLTTNNWSTVGPQNFEDVYNADADKTLTTSSGNFEIARGSGSFTLSGTGSTTLNQSTLTSTSTAGTTLNAGAAASDAIKLNASNAAGGITANWGTGGLNFSSSTGAFSITGSGPSTVGTDSGNLNLQTTTSGDVALNSAGFVTFQDSNLGSPVKLNNSQTGLSATYTGAGDLGILDALNGLTLTTAGQGASLVGFDNTGFTNITGSDLQTALASIDSKIGSGGANVDTLTFNPQYPNYVISRNGGTNQGTLIDDFDGTNNKQYFRWTSNQTSLQNIDVKFRFPLPTDFVSTGDFTLAYRTGTVTTADNKVDVTVTDVTNANTICGSSLANASANAWATATVTAATLNGGCAALAAGDLMEVDVKFYDISDVTAPGTFADASQVALAYNN